MIIARYITKEILWSLFAIVGILLLIALSNRFAVYLAKAATGEMPVSVVFRLVWLYIPELLSYVIPLGFFVSLLFVYGRLYVDSEMTVLSACGFSLGYLTRLTLIIGSILMIGTALLTFWVVPNFGMYREQAASESEALAVIQSMLPGRFQTALGGRLVFYIEEVSSKNKILKGVFIAEQPLQSGSSAEDSKGLTLLTSATARMKQDPKTHDFYLVLNDGYRYQGNPGSANYTVVKFAEYGRNVKQDTNQNHNEGLKLKSSGALLKSKAAEDKAEFQWRLSIPLSVLILGLLAIPLARVQPRQGRFAKLLPAVILYIIYYNLFTISKRWIAGGAIPSFIGVWWVHIIFGILAVVLLIKDSGWFWEYQYHRNKNKGGS